MILEQVSTLIEELNESNSVLEKKRVLETHPECKEILTYVYSPFTQFNITSKNLEKRSDLIEDTYIEIIPLLDKLNNLEITGHKAISIVNGFVQRNIEYKDTIYRIIDKNLKTRTDAKIINQVWPGLVPEFKVALANKFEDQAHKINFNKETFLASRKMDGIRCLARCENGKINFYSRKGKEFDTLKKVENDILSNLPMGFDFVLDGELCIVDQEGNEDFTSIVKEIRRKDHTVENPKYKIFDILTLEEFDAGESKEIVSNRINRLDFDACEYCEMIDQIKIESAVQLQEMTDDAVSAGWEGLIIRKDVGYKGKRSNDLLKVKKMHDAEYTIKDVVFGPIRYIKDGKDTSEEMLSSIIIEHKGNQVNVGSGFSIADRQYYYLHPEEVIGKEATIKYFEESTDKDGNYSLRFPIVKHIFNGRRDV